MSAGKRHLPKNEDTCSLESPAKRREVDIEHPHARRCRRGDRKMQEKVEYILYLRYVKKQLGLVFPTKMETTIMKYISNREFRSKYGHVKENEENIKKLNSVLGIVW